MTTLLEIPARCVLTLRVCDSSSCPFVLYLYDTEFELNDAAIADFLLDRSLDMIAPQARAMWIQRTVPRIHYEERAIHPFAYRHITLKRVAKPEQIYTLLKRLFWQHTRQPNSRLSGFVVCILKRFFAL